MTILFLSYRRADTSGYAGRLTDALEARFGAGSVFQDVETIAPGTNFEEEINAAVARCEAFIVLIGDTWSTGRAADERARLAEPHDFVRLEVACALRAGKPILPVLVEGATMPQASALPPDLRALSRLQAIELSDSRWDYDVARVEEAVRKLIRRAPLPNPRRRFVFASAGVAILAGAAASYSLRTRPAEVSGRWTMPNGSFWTVVQNGSALAIEETHYQSKEVWKKGSGTVQHDRIRVSLNLVYGAPRRFEGELRLSSDSNTLSGEIIDTTSNHKTSETLLRNR
ncbi:MAG TPA: toll/interleukin-1 receptor domain-containing protein [Burkholderiales bacterium]|nr:toll/interleukin-1 receptor domain-containing protein [Burkholderiales bacterium]